MDYAEEQAQELEALEAILMDDLQGLILAQSRTCPHVSSLISSHPAALNAGAIPTMACRHSRRVTLPRACHHAEFDGTRPDGWDSSCACYSVAISPADDGAVSTAADDAAACAKPAFQPY